MNVLVLHGGHVNAPHVAVYPNHRRQAGRQMEVGGAILDAECQQLTNVHQQLLRAIVFNQRSVWGLCLSLAGNLRQFNKQATELYDNWKLNAAFMPFKLAP
jgi:hypothetical protein